VGDNGLEMFFCVLCGSSFFYRKQRKEKKAIRSRLRDKQPFDLLPNPVIPAPRHSRAGGNPEKQG
jgi:hypothetical protein